MGKIKYLIGRIGNMSFKNMFSTIDEIHNRTNKSKVYLFLI